MSEVEKILEMISSGKISVDDGERLLKAIKGSQPQTEYKPIKPKVETPKKEESSKKEGNIIIEIKSNDGEIIKLNLPVGLAGFMLNMLPKDKMADFEINDVNLKEILDKIPNITNGEDQEILNMSSDDGAHIRIYVKY